MADFATRTLPATPDETAPDGSAVRLLLTGRHGSMAHFTLLPGQTSSAVVHRTVEEIWYFLAGSGEMWRARGASSEVVSLMPGTCVSIPAETAFQFRASAAAPLTAVAVTMPPWPGDQEAALVEGPWTPSAGAAVD